MWQPVTDKCTAIVIYPFNGTSILPAPHGQDLNLGDLLTVLEENPTLGWLRCTKPNKKPHLIPISYTYRTNKDNQTSEITTVVREWGQIWKRKFAANNDGSEYQLHVIGKAIRELVDGRRSLITGNLTKEQSEELKLKLATKIDWGNRKLGLDLIPRDGYKIVGPEVGVVQLYRVHVASVESAEAARTTLRKKRPAKVQQPAGHHLYMTVRDYNCNLAEDSQVYFSIFDAGRNIFISDRYAITLPASNSTFIDKLQTISTLFLDLCTHEFTQDLYIVTHILRLGRMFHTDSHKKSTQNYRRPFACGALHINSIESDTISEFNYKLYTCDEKEFYNIHELIIKHSSKVTLMGNNSISVALRLFHGDINVVMDENSILLKGIIATRKIGFPDVIMPGVVRNDLYITISHGEFEKGGKTTGKNIEVSVQVLDSTGALVENTVFGAVNSSNYESIILYHNNNPQWNEIIRVCVPIESFPTAHVRILFRHCSTKEKNDKKLFGFSFIKLMDDHGTTIKDSSHSLPIYKCEDSTKLHPKNYMNGSINFPRSTKETLYISTQLVSTKLTQNMDLVSLLKWKQHPEKVKQTLVNIAKLPGEELVKFLQDVLDVIFAMFIGEDGYSTDYSGDAFIVLINIFTLLDDSKFQHFKPVIDAYIHDHFAAALVYKGLLSSVRHYADVTAITEKDFIKQIQKCFRTSEYIFKFIVQSRILFARATGGNMEDSFRRDVEDMFSSFYNLVSINVDTSEEFVSTQAALLLNLHKIYNNLGRVVPIDQLSGLIYNLFHSIPLNPSAHPLSPAKLTALVHLVGSDLFALKGPRQLLLPEICKHIRHHLSIRDELKLTSEILLTTLHNLHNDRENCITPTEDDIETISSYNLENLINCVLILERTSSVITPLVTNLTSLLQQMNEFHYNRIFDEFKDIHQIRNFILRALFVFRDLIKMDVFNPDWATMKLLNCSIILNSIHNFSKALSTFFIKPFDSALILEYLNVCISFIIQPSLQVENFGDNKRSYILNTYGDMRVQMSKEILDNWEIIGIDKYCFIPSIVGPILLLTLIPENQLRNDTIPLFYDLLVAEWTKSGDVKEVEAELIDKLDTYILEGKGDEDYILAFNSILTTKLQCMHADQPFTQAYKKFIASITKLLEHLYDYRQVPNDSDNKDKKMQCTQNLLSYYKQEVDCKPMYIKYIYKLIELHVSEENFGEAGYTLLLHSNMMDWEDDYERKENIYLKAIQYFDNGKLWESGIPLCKELAVIYESKYDYAKLSNILIKQANYFNNILTMHRPDPEYFRVGFFGCGFPLFVRNKEFIYRGLDYERLTTFMQKLLAEWPGAEVLKNVPVDEGILNGDGQYIQIRSVKPLQNNPIVLSAPFKIRSFFFTNFIFKFQFDRPMKSDDENVKNMWVERTTLETISPLPGILRSCQVKTKTIVVLNPVSYACNRITEVNKNLEELVSQYSSDNANGNSNVNQLSMRLQGILDASVMGGLPKYQEAFFNPEYIAANRDTVEDVTQLSKLINDQVEILDKALALHGNIITPGVQPLHNRLVECFNIMRTSVSTTCPLPAVLTRSDSLRINSSIINTPLPPLPNNSHNNNNSNNSSSNSNNNSNHNSLNNGNSNNRISSGYGTITFRSSTTTTQSDDEDVYSTPTTQPPPIPNRKKKRQINSGDYIIMPPSRARELAGTPPRPPKEPNKRTSTPVPAVANSEDLMDQQIRESRTPPPVPPKPSSQPESKRCSSNSTNSNSGSHKEYYILPKEKEKE